MPTGKDKADLSMLFKDIMFPCYEDPAKRYEIVADDYGRYEEGGFSS